MSNAQESMLVLLSCMPISMTVVPCRELSAMDVAALDALNREGLSPVEKLRAVDAIIKGAMAGRQTSSRHCSRLARHARRAGDG